ncbi:unnamed protein product, partial [Didymodactylos carnosus]
MNHQPRIAFISEHGSPLASLGGADSGGQNVYVGQLAKSLAARGYQIHVFTRWENATLPLVVKWCPGVSVIHVKAGPQMVIPKEELLPCIAEFTQSIFDFICTQKLEYELIHAHYFMSAMAAVQLKNLLNIPFIVVTFHSLGHVKRLHHGTDIRFLEERLQIEKDVVKQADYIVAECPQEREDLMNYYNAPSSKIVIIPGGFNPDEIYPIEKAVARKMLNINTNRHILLLLGRMVPQKGIDNVIHALSRLKIKDSQSVYLIVVGGESDNGNPTVCAETRRLQQLARENGLETSISFVGRKNREQLKFYYSAADIFITTPWYEQFGITVLEAMACRTAVIGANVGGIKYTIVDGETGALVAPKDPNALASKITELIDNTQLREYMGNNGLKRVNGYFTWNHIAEQ